MMAKMFYTLEEAKATLGKGEEDIKQYAREGRLREFRDGPRLMFKADQVEQLKSELVGGDQVDLGVSDSGGLIGLVDTTGASGTSITLSDTDHGSQGSAVGLKTKEDTAMAGDLGLSGSAVGMPSPRIGSGSGSGLGSGSHGSRAGINVFGTEEVGADPSAQTAITSGVREQIDLASVGSGSGLLDLTRESDDTSLGAVLDEINPNSTRARAAAVEIAEGGLDLEEPRGGVSRNVAAPVYVEAADPMAMALGFACLGAALMVLFGIYAVVGGVMNANSDPVKWFDHRGWWMPAAVGLGAVAIFFVIGLLTGKTSSGRSS